MSANDLDRRLASFFDAASSEALPGGLLDDVYAVTRQLPQRKEPAARPTAAIATWWANPFGVAPRLRILAVAVLLILALVAALTYVAGHSRRLPPPFGPAGNGLIVFDLDQRLYVAQPDGTATPLDIGLGHSWNPAYSPDGTKLAFYSQAELTPSRVSLFVADADGTNPRPITGDLAVVGDKLASIGWSPDSQRIAFASSEPGLASSLFIAQADGSGVVRLTHDAVQRVFPTWSPRGDFIAYQRVDEKGAGIAIIAPDGTGERTLMNDGVMVGYNFAWPVWSPDGTKLAFQHYNTQRLMEEVGFVDLNRRYVPAPENTASEAPQWSNDGTRLAYFLVDTTKLVVLDVATRSRTVLPAGLADCGVFWSPDDRELLGIANCKEAVRFPLDHPGAATRLTDAQGDLHMFTQQRVAP
jgi:Tol biopolymer transport system component